ncbi:MAG TPA: ammonium transporter [Kofleriaceae bacterium]|nr:ammonium transporter [Kofleriaceae bacterium]
MNSGDTAWLLVATALVMLMTPGLALFYGGMVQGKNVLSTFMHSFMALGLITIQWVVIGYSLSFGHSHHGLIGGTNFAFLDGVGMDPQEGKTYPHLLFMMFQGMFAIITVALISGAYAERLKFSAYLLFTLLWTTLVYDPIAHWVWNSDGWLFKRGALDFAGGTVVHMASGFSALIVAMMVGKRIGYPNIRHQPHNLTMTLIGAGLLWFGWFGFNAGSALSAGGVATQAFVNTHIAAAAGALAWGLVEMMRIKKATMLGVASGLVAGLVAITPAAGFVTPMAAIIIGLAAGVVCYAACLAKARLGYDDALDAFGVHGVGGALGALLTGVFASSVVTTAALGIDTTKDPAHPGGLLAGNMDLFVNQLIAVGVAAAYSAAVTFVILKVVKAVVGLRVDADVEREGLDTNLHGETGYTLGTTTTTLGATEEPEAAKTPVLATLAVSEE